MSVGMWKSVHTFGHLCLFITVHLCGVCTFILSRCTDYMCACVCLCACVVCLTIFTNVCVFVFACACTHDACTFSPYMRKERECVRFCMASRVLPAGACFARTSERFPSAPPSLVWAPPQRQMFPRRPMLWPPRRTQHLTFPVIDEKY